MRALLAITPKTEFGESHMLHSRSQVLPGNAFLEALPPGFSEEAEPPDLRSQAEPRNEYNLRISHLTN